MIGRRPKLERFRVVLGLSAAGMTYREMARYIDVGSRQRVQQLVVEAVKRLPKLAGSLGVTGRRYRGRRPVGDHEAEAQPVAKIEKPRKPQAPVRKRHMATARKLLNQYGGCYPGATEMMRLGHGALYQFKRKYPKGFERLIRECRASRKRGRRRPQS